jgi:hypothetical protein
MSEQGNFNNGADVALKDTWLVYPRESAVHAVASDPHVLSSAAFREAGYGTPEGNITIVEGLKKYVSSKHNLSLSDTTVALMAYEDIRETSLELARAQEISETRAGAVERIVDFICDPNRIVPSAGRRLTHMKREAHAN